MSAMTKANAKAHLSRTLERFKSVTGQSYGVFFTWEGGLSIMGTSKFKNFVMENKDEMWRNIAYPDSNNTSKPAHEQEIISMIEDHRASYNVSTLRRIISWITQKTTGWLLLL